MLAYPRRIRIYRISNTGFFVIARPQCVGVRRRSGSECNVGTDLPLIARRAELAILTGAIEATRRGQGEAVLLTGEAGVGKTRLLIETQREAERRGVLVLKGRADRIRRSLSTASGSIRPGVGSICSGDRASGGAADPRTGAARLDQ